MSVIPNAVFCGIETRPQAEPAGSPCKRTSLPCGPVGFERIHQNSGEETDDLDGDGQRDVVVGGRLTVQSKDVFAAIYRGGEDGYRLADYRVVPAHAEPTFANVLLVEQGRAPLLRDGHDLIESSGKSLSIARLRRFDGQRFATLLTFCAHRSEPTAGAQAAARQGLNRVDFVDVDRNGEKEVVIQGLLPPVVFRFVDAGLRLIEDPALTHTYRTTSEEAVRAKKLRAEAERLLDEGDVRRAADTYQRAFLNTPHDMDIGLAAAEAHIRAGHPDRALEIGNRLHYQEPSRAAVLCVLAVIHRAMGNTRAERPAVQLCVAHETDETRRRSAESRLRELSGQTTEKTPPAPPPDGAQKVLEEALGTSSP